MAKAKKQSKAALHLEDIKKCIDTEDDDGVYNLLEEEKKLLIKDFREVKKIEAEENAEATALKHFENKLQELIKTVIYLEGYVQEIKGGNEMLKINPSVKELGLKLKGLIEEVSVLSKSITQEEKKIMEFAKDIKSLLKKANEFNNLIFG